MRGFAIICKKIEDLDLSNLTLKIYKLLTIYGIRVIAAIVIFLLGRLVAKGVTNFIKKVMARSKVDETLVSFVGHLSYIALLASELADSSVNFVVRAWTSADDYWGFYFDTTEAVKKRFDAEGINIPFPQRDVHVYEH